MSVTSGFFNSLSGDRKYDAIQISSMFDGLITDGIYNGFLESFMVTASSPASMVVTVGEGRCWFNHTWTLNDAPLPLTLDVGDVVLNRIDTIVIDVDSTDTVRACTIKVIKGTPSSQAVRPTLENTETHHQYPLCDISVVAGATTVTQSNITNRRGTSDCPFVATLMKSVDVDDLLIQWESQWNDWMTDRANAMDTWTAEQQAAFTTWFETVQDTLDEDTAGNLYNLITQNTGINATATHAEGVVAITAVGNPVNIVFLAPSDWAETDTYTYNGTSVELVDLLGEPVEDAWVEGSPVSLTISAGKAFFKNGGGRYKPTDLPPLNPNFKMEITEGDTEDTVTVTADKLLISPNTDMLAGGQWEYGTELSTAPGEGQNIKHWTREQLVTSGKPFDGLYLGDVTASDAVNETILWLPENQSGDFNAVPAITLPLSMFAITNDDGTFSLTEDTGPTVSFSFTVPHGAQPYVRQYTQNYEEHYQTMLEGGVLPPLVDEGPTYSEVLSENTWTQIAQAVADKDPILDVWQIGDTKDEVIAGETLTFAIMGKNMDDLADGSGKAGLTFGMTQLMASTRQMNSSNTNTGSFAGSAMYTWLSGTIYPNLPTELKDAIKAVNKKTSSGGASSSIRTDAMYLWLFAEIEVFGSTTYSYAGEGTQYPYFATVSERIKRLSNGAGNAAHWWERSPYRNLSYSFCRVDTSGLANFGDAGISRGVCFGFCI